MSWRVARHGQAPKLPEGGTAKAQKERGEEEERRRTTAIRLANGSFAVALLVQLVQVGQNYQRSNAEAEARTKLIAAQEKERVAIQHEFERSRLPLTKLKFHFTVLVPVKNREEALKEADSTMKYRETFLAALRSGPPFPRTPIGSPPTVSPTTPAFKPIVERIKGGTITTYPSEVSVLEGLERYPYDEYICFEPSSLIFEKGGATVDIGLTNLKRGHPMIGNVSRPQQELLSFSWFDLPGEARWQGRQMASIIDLLGSELSMFAPGLPDNASLSCTFYVPGEGDVSVELKQVERIPGLGKSFFAKWVGKVPLKADPPK